MRVIAVLLLTGLVAIFGHRDAFAAGPAAKVALVIGNGKYPDNDVVMNDALNDAKAMAEELKRDGFDVELGSDLSGAAMHQAFERLYAKIQRGSVAMLFFDGFAIESSRQSYLLPVDAQIWTEPDVAHDGLNLEAILSEMNKRGALVKIAVIDASRRNPFERRFRPYSAGLAPIITPNDTLVLYATAPGSVISSVKSDHSLFVTELLREIRAPGTTAEQAFRHTQSGVSTATQHEQVPWLSSSMTTEFAFFPGPGTSDRPTEPPPFCMPPTPPTPPSPDEIANDQAISEYSARIRQDPNDHLAYYKRGQLYAIKGAYAPAAADFGQAIRLDAHDAQAFNNRCWTRAAIGDLANALVDCNEALRLKPDLYDALDSRGLVYLKAGHHQDAIRDYNASLEMNPGSVSSLFGRGIALKRSGGDGSADIKRAKEMDHNVANEFAGYGVNECAP